jgi:NAD(P)-dependent dehydrogenase (short-subunit alcohol dehydrogenase family)
MKQVIQHLLSFIPTRIVALAPGFIETDINSYLSIKRSWREETIKLIPLRRAGTPGRCFGGCFVFGKRVFENSCRWWIDYLSKNKE